MKTTLFLSLTLLMAVCLSAIPANKTIAKKKKVMLGSAWIHSNHGFMACDGQQYEVRDVEYNATFKWYWVDNRPGRPRYYLGTLPTIEIDLQPGDEIQLQIDFEDEELEDYVYYETLSACE